MPANVSTADLYDAYGANIQVLSPIFKEYGAIKQFCGEIITLKLFEDNTLVRQTLSLSGKGKVLVVDGGGSLRCALLGDNIAQLAVDNQWNGIVIYGCVRDVKILTTLPIGIKAINNIPIKSVKRNEGQSGINLNFANATIKEGDYLYADEDGIIISDTPLSLRT
jgi:regulator of ribonuclease activity A